MTPAVFVAQNIEILANPGQEDAKCAHPKMHFYILNLAVHLAQIDKCRGADATRLVVTLDKALHSLNDRIGTAVYVDIAPQLCIHRMLHCTTADMAVHCIGPVFGSDIAMVDALQLPMVCICCGVDCGQAVPIYFEWS